MLFASAAILTALTLQAMRCHQSDNDSTADSIIETAYIVQPLCEHYAHDSTLAIQSFGPTSDTEWFALMTFSEQMQPLLAVDSSIHCYLMPMQQMVPNEVFRLTRCTFFINPDTFLLLSPTLSSVASLLQADNTSTSIFSLQGDTQVYIGRAQQVDTTNSTCIYELEGRNSILDTKHPVRRFASTTALPPILLSSTQVLIFYGLERREEESDIYCLVRINCDEDVPKRRRGRADEIRCDTNRTHDRCIRADFAIDCGHYDQNKSLLIIVNNVHQKVYFYNSFNRNVTRDSSKLHPIEADSALPFTEFLVCGTKDSHYAVSAAIVASVVVFLVIILLIAYMTWTDGRELWMQGLRQSKESLKAVKRRKSSDGETMAVATDSAAKSSTSDDHRQVDCSPRATR